MSLYEQEFRPVARYRPENQQTFISAIENTLKNWVSKTLAIFIQWKKHRTNRQAFTHLLALDDHILDDIGVTKEDVLWASQLPKHIDASVELEKIARANKLNGK